jgi:hypothetical protein
MKMSWFFFQSGSAFSFLYKKKEEERRTRDPCCDGIEIILKKFQISAITHLKKKMGKPF